MYVYVIGYTYRSIRDAFCSRTLFPGRAILLDQLLTYSNVIDETRRYELTQYPKLSKSRSREMTWGQGQYITYYVRLIEFFT